MNTSLLHRTTRTLAALAFALALSSASASAHDDAGERRQPELPSPACDDVEVPAGHRLHAKVHALGVQIYRWDGNAWVFVAPEARLFADPGHRALVGIHYAGPTWEAIDGSQVTAARAAGCSPDRGTIPWLRLVATSTSAHGRFARVTQIQRLDTIGGAAPAEPGTFVGEEARVPYVAEYTFYRAVRD